MVLLRGSSQIIISLPIFFQTKDYVNINCPYKLLKIVEVIKSLFFFYFKKKLLEKEVTKCGFLKKKKKKKKYFILHFSFFNFDGILSKFTV